MSLSTNIIEIENIELLDQIANKCDEAMGYNPFSKADFKRAVDEDITESFNAAPDFNMTIKEMAEQAIDELLDRNINIIWK